MVDYSSLDDGALLALITRRDNDALGELYNRYGRLVYSIALNAINDQAAAEEIAQDVFLRVWDNASTYRTGRGKVTTWISSITRHRAIDRLRHRSVRPESRSVHWEELPAAAIPQSDSLEDQMKIIQDRDRILKGMSQLPEEQKTALALAYFRGYTHREIGEALDIPLGTVKTRIRLAMQKLRTLLEEVPTIE